MISGPIEPCYWFKVHGGIGDQIWMYKKFVNLDLPVFISVASEAKHRPRRTGYFLDHLPKVCGWRYEDEQFYEHGDWPPKEHPSCCIDKNWSDLNVPLNSMYLIECNKWIENGNRLENWLPDLPTTHHFDFEPINNDKYKDSKHEYVVFHSAGWKDIHDAIFVDSIREVSKYKKCYIVGGSYDGRPARIHKLAKSTKVDCDLLTDLSWDDMFSLISNARFVCGHTSGFTILADTLRVPGICYNVDVLPSLKGTWNTTEDIGNVQIGDIDEWQTAIVGVVDILKSGTGDKSPRQSNIQESIRFTCRTNKPKSVLIKIDDVKLQQSAINIALASFPRLVVIVNGKNIKSNVEARLKGVRNKPTVVYYDSLDDLKSFSTFDLSIIENSSPDKLNHIVRHTTQNGTVIYNSSVYNNLVNAVRVSASNWYIYAKE